MLRRKENRKPAVSDLPGKCHVFRPENRQVDRNTLLHGSDGQLEGLARAVRQGQLEGFPLELDLLVRKSHADHCDVLPRPLQLFGETDSIQVDTYFVYPEELKTVARVQVFRDFVVSKAQRWPS